MSLLKRQIVKIGEHIGPSIKVSQFNTLAASLAVSGFEIEKINIKLLDWEYRCPLIIEEIKSNNVDFATLEEVDKSKFPDLQNGLSNFVGIHYKKTKDDNLDGCAIFYNSKT
jgi:mRNA deadenylase 3'-5' endonuclease subunit Ccr4